MAIQIVNTTRTTTLAERCEEARSFLARTKGLMGREDLPAGTGLIIKPCSSVHSFFMRFPIDVVFVGRDEAVVGLTVAMPPNRPYAGAWRARYVIELPAGVIAASNTQVGDQLLLRRS